MAINLSDVNLMRIAGDNLTALKAAKDGEMLPYTSYQQIVLIGAKHSPEVYKIVRAAEKQGASRGRIRFTQGEGKLGKRGTLTVDSFRGDAAEQKLFVAEIRKVSDKTVVFI